MVATHCVDPFQPGDIVRSPMVALFTRHINIMFIFVSGFLFQYLIHRFSYGPYLKTKAKNVLLPYFLISLPAILIYATGLKPLDKFVGLVTADQPVKLAALMLATGSSLAPFWFIPMMTIFYLISPVLKWIDDHPRAYGIMLPWLILALFVGRSVGDANPLQNAIFFGPIYLLGMGVSRLRDRVIPVLARFWPLLIAAILIPIPISPSAAIWDPVMLLTKILVCLGLVGLLSKVADHLPRKVDYLGDISFGIFFVHYYIVAAITILANKGKLPFLHGFAVYFGVLFLVVALSSIIVMAIREIFGRYSRQLVGA
ncbi:surface polysaccharide O-acyltransferase-like enzyme [Sphingomonas sp. SORGH_AS870]|nr:surface polysaccharide O-acyltransferase-like enzyme [Sphingomonas sp. SORGH_AS_0870]